MKTLLHRCGDALLTNDPVQRIRLSQTALGVSCMAVGALVIHYFAWVGVADARYVWTWTAASLGGMVGFFILIRSGLSQSLADPAVTTWQIVYALVSAAAAYALVGAGRGAAFPIILLTLMFSMFQLRAQQLARMALFAVLLVGTVMALMARSRPEVYVPVIELGHFLILATTLPAVAALAHGLGRLRRRLRDQKDELAQALERIQELAISDELTGLPNRRHMLEMMGHELLRSERAGRPFCLAIVDIDHFKSINDTHGHAVGDEVLRQLATAMRAVQRGTDTLARWGGEEFVQLLSDTPLPPAIQGVERLREHVQGLRIVIGATELQVTVSCGIAQHVAGESLHQTMERADRALYDAKAQGRNRTLVGDPPTGEAGAATTPTAATPASSDLPAPALGVPSPKSNPHAPPQ